MSDATTILELAKSRMIPCYSPPQLVPDYGQGSFLWDTEGKRYLDFTTGIAVNALGHAHPKVIEAITQQVARFSHTANIFHHEGYVSLCDKLCDLTFGERVFLTNSGTEAVEAAIKLVRRYFHVHGEDRPQMVATEGGFHGRTYGALSVTNKATYRTGFGPLLPAVTTVPYNDIEAMRSVVNTQTAAVIVEPIQGNTGVYIPAPDYLTKLRQICDESGALLILDEIQTGVGRTGQWFSYQHESMQPDVLTTAKALGGGLPVGGLITTDAIGSVLEFGSHGSTFGGNPVACAAGLATIDVIEQEGLLQHAAHMGECFTAMLRDVASQSEWVTEVRGRGLMIGVELTTAARPVLNACRDNGLLVTVAGPEVLRILPPLNTTTEELELAAELLLTTLRNHQP